MKYYVEKYRDVIFFTVRRRLFVDDSESEDEQPQPKKQCTPDKLEEKDDTKESKTNENIEGQF